MVDLSTIPHAFLLPPARPTEAAVLESDLPQSKHDDVYSASGNVVLTYGDHILRADALTYNNATDDVTAEGHVVLTGGDNDEHIEATHGTYNLRTQTGRFYDVHGSVEMSRASTAPAITTTNSGIAAANTAHLPGYQTSNPFLFEGRIVVKTGPTDYTVYNGSVTSCLLPHPDWQLYARKISLDSGQAKAANSTFKLLGLPLLFFPYVTHPVDNQQRQSGLLIPVLGYSSASKDTGSKGFTIGEQFYLVLGRSADLTVGSLYYSLRGFSENGTFRYHGVGDDFFNAHFSALQDRGFTTSTGIYTNQGGVDITSSFRRKLTTHVRAVGDAEYLSSYIYREAFTENFNQAVSTDITSIVYLTDQKNGFSVDGRVDRYEGLKVVQTAVNPSEEVKIYHTPSIDFTGLDHPIPGTPLLWSITASAAGLKRAQPNFSTGGITARIDLRPEIALPLGFAGWHSLSSVAVRETAYSRSRQVPYGNNATPIELNSPLNRADFDLNIDIRPPVIERTFTVPERWHWLLGDQVRHTIEPDITYRNVRGIDNFLSVLRFDDVDLASDTDELEYGVTQHLYFRARRRPPGRSAAAPRRPPNPCLPALRLASRQRRRSTSSAPTSAPPWMLTASPTQRPQRPISPPAPTRARLIPALQPPPSLRSRSGSPGSSPRSISLSRPSAAPSSMSVATSSTPRWTSPASPSSPSRAASRRSNRICASAPPAIRTSPGTSTTTLEPRSSPAPTPSSMYTRATSSAASPTRSSTPRAAPIPRSSTPPPTR